MDIVLTRKQMWAVGGVLGIIMFICGMSFNMIYLYYDDTITIQCSDGTQMLYNKTDLNNLTYLCSGDINIYKYNDNTGLGAYFPDEIAVKKVEYENLNYNVNKTYIFE